MAQEIPIYVAELLSWANADLQYIVHDPAKVGRLCAVSTDKAWQSQCLAWLDEYFKVERSPLEVSDLFFSGRSQMAFETNEGYRQFFDSVRVELRRSLNS